MPNFFCYYAQVRGESYSCSNLCQHNVPRPINYHSPILGMVLERTTSLSHEKRTGMHMDEVHSVARSMDLSRIYGFFEPQMMYSLVLGNNNNCTFKHDFWIFVRTNLATLGTQACLNLVQLKWPSQIFIVTSVMTHPTFSPLFELFIEATSYFCNIQKFILPWWRTYLTIIKFQGSRKRSGTPPRESKHGDLSATLTRFWQDTPNWLHPRITLKWSRSLEFDPENNGPCIDDNQYTSWEWWNFEKL